MQNTKSTLGAQEGVKDSIKDTVDNVIAHPENFNLSPKEAKVLNKSGEIGKTYLYKFLKLFTQKLPTDTTPSEHEILEKYIAKVLKEKNLKVTNEKTLSNILKNPEVYFKDEKMLSQIESANEKDKTEIIKGILTNLGNEDSALPFLEKIFAKFVEKLKPFLKPIVDKILAVSLKDWIVKAEEVGDKVKEAVKDVVDDKGDAIVDKIDAMSDTVTGYLKGHVGDTKSGGVKLGDETLQEISDKVLSLNDEDEVPILEITEELDATKLTGEESLHPTE